MLLLEHPHRQAELLLPDTSKEVLKLILQFIYTGKTEVVSGHLNCLHSTLKHLQIKGVQQVGGQDQGPAEEIISRQDDKGSENIIDILETNSEENLQPSRKERIVLPKPGTRDLHKFKKNSQSSFLLLKDSNKKPFKWNLHRENLLRAIMMEGGGRLAKQQQQGNCNNK